MSPAATIITDILTTVVTTTADTTCTVEIITAIVIKRGSDADGLMPLPMDVDFDLNKSRYNAPT